MNHLKVGANINVRQCSGHADPDLGGGGWRWRGRGAMGAFGSGGTFLMWKWTFALSFPFKSLKLLCTKLNDKSFHLSFFNSSEGRLAGGEVGRGAGGRGGREEESLLSFLSKHHSSRDQSAATQESPTLRHAFQYEVLLSKGTPDWPITACTMHSGYPARPRERLGHCRDRYEWLTNAYAMQYQWERFSPSRSTAQAMQESWPVFPQVQRGAFDREKRPSRSRRRGEAGGIQNTAVQHSSPETKTSLWGSAGGFSRAITSFNNQPLSSHLSNIGLWTSAGFSLWGSLCGLARCTAFIGLSCLFSSLSLSFFTSSA